MSKFTFVKFLMLPFLFLVLCKVQAQVAVNEVMATNLSVLADEDGDFNDWIEIYNYGSAPVNLQGYGLTDTPATPFKWVFPAVTLAPNQYLLIWASDKNRAVAGQPLHTNFKISGGGEAIVITAPGGTPSDQAPAMALDNNVSWGRQPDGTGPFMFFYTATPGAANTGTGLNELLLPPVFSHDSGLFTQPFSLVLSHNNPNATIIYTLDGSEPMLNNTSGTTYQYKNAYKLEATDNVGPLLSDSYTSNTYSAPIAIADRSADPDQLANKNTRQNPLYAPANPVRKATVVRARAYVNGVGSEIISKTFFVWAGGNPYQLPVISLQIQENRLFDYEDGVYTAGIDYDNWRAANPANNQWYRPEWCNYWRSGDLWEYPVHVEFFEPGTLTSAMNVNGGFRIHGNNSRALGIKNLRLYARSDYDDTDVFEHDLFNTQIPGAPNPNNTDFKRLMLRGDGAGGSIAYDVVFNRAMQPVFNGIARIRQAVHFINGEFWGITALRDRMDKYHYAYNFDLDKDNIVQIGCGGSNCDLDEGTNTDYQGFIDFRNFIMQNDMANAANYTQVTNQMDMRSFIDHMVSEIYAANDSYERTFWKVRTPGNQQYGDGKWRLTIQDFEASLKSSTNWLAHWASTTNSANESFFGYLLANNSFKTDFINRFADLLNTALNTQRFTAIVNETFNEVAPYMAEDANRFPRLNFYKNSEKQNLLTWGSTRPVIQRDQIKTQFNLPGMVNLILNVSDTAAGIVKMNTVTIEPSTPGVPQNPYPWTGIYFNGVPVTVEAIAQQGYIFSHWSGDVSGTNPVLTFTPTADMQVMANFTPEATPEEVVYFWMMGSAIPNDTPLQNLDATYESNALNAGINYISCLSGYPFNSTDPNWRKASMERKNVPTPLNYRPEANNGAAYASGSMKGLQIKQPFRSGTQENIMEFVVPTTNLQNIKFSLAVKTDGAAESIVAEYWNGTQWTSTGLATPSASISTDFDIKMFDFSPVAYANNNAGFKIRLRFDGADMTSDTGKAVHINNIAVEGQQILSAGDHTAGITLKVYPNPANSVINILAGEEIENVVMYSIYGQIMYQGAPKASAHVIKIDSMPTGIYFVKVTTPKGEQTAKIIKQ